ncbi:MAG: hypothetical protein H7Z75_02550 [Ferruginibacter sp.]|nr:hypothetical protein [Cytophagales bacterium]
MKNFFLPLLAVLCACLTARGQYKSVTFDYERSAFNEGQPLPAETYFTVSGEVTPDVEMVEIRIMSKSSAKENEPLYKALWKRAPVGEGNTFQVPISYKLRSDAEYDFRIAYYKVIDSTGNGQFRAQLFNYLDKYVDQSLDVEKNRIRLNTPPHQIVRDLNKIVERATLYYNNRSNIGFPGFSDMVLRGLEGLQNKNLAPGQYNQNPDSASSKQQMKSQYADEEIEAVKEMVHGEVNTILNTQLVTVTDSKDIKNYRTEKLKSSLTLNFGYGGVYFDGDINNLSYGDGFYAGVSFPFGNSAFASKFLSRTTFSAGVFLKNFSNLEGQTISGPVLGRPLYVALGYPILDFLRFNAGATVLQNSSTAPSGINLQQVFLRPYVGLSVDVNVWLGLGKNKL